MSRKRRASPRPQLWPPHRLLTSLARRHRVAQHLRTVSRAMPTLSLTARPLSPSTRLLAVYAHAPRA